MKSHEKLEVAELITDKELKQIDRNYFHIIQANGFAIYLQSKNTKHFWGIMVAEYPIFRNFHIYHKHNRHDSYHRHRDAPTLSDAIECIKGHDIFQMNGRNKDSKKDQKALFEKRKLSMRSVQVQNKNISYRY